MKDINSKFIDVIIVNMECGRKINLKQYEFIM